MINGGRKEVYIVYANVFKVCMKVPQSCPTLQSHGLYSPWNSLGWNTGVGSLYHLKGLFPTQESNPGLLNCRQILYQLSYQGYIYIGENTGKLDKKMVSAIIN